MPKLRAIDFDKIKNGDFEESKRVIKDLLMLTPRGPKQNQRGGDYHKFECYPGKEAVLKSNEDYVAAQEKGEGVWYFGNSYQRNASWWGYTPEQLYYTAKTLGATGTWLNESDFYNLLLRHFSDDGYGRRGAKLTRGSRRLANRFTTAWRDAIAGGKLGDLAFTASVETLKVDTDRYYGPTTNCGIDVNFAGKTKEEATMMLKTMFGHCVASTDVRWTAWQAAEPAEILQKNLAQIERLQAKRAKAVEQLAQIQEFINNIDTLQEAVQMYSMSICD